MLFSSIIFLYFFLPIVFIIYFGLRLIEKKKKISHSITNYWLLLASLFFYAWGEPKFVFIMIGSIIFNYLMALIIDKAPKAHTNLISSKKPRWGGTNECALVVDIVGNLSILFVFKYLDFSIENFNVLFGTKFQLSGLLLPIGISFFTFQAMSYVIDVYRGEVAVQKNPFYLGLYISFFPQLIAGPIVRYRTIEKEICNRTESIEGFSEGLERFIIGLSKKIIIANNMAIIADAAFNNIGTSSVAMLWLGSFAYTFQIFFDFSGYSDMAIGLGRMFGFHFMENFDYPYAASSITDFWRRWHISLSSWFRDYVYIPIGGNRKGIKRQILNLFIVWLLTGIWHGANWTFIVWGLSYFVLLVFEKITGIDKTKSTIIRIIYRIFTLFAVNLLWVVFRSDNIKQAVEYIGRMFCGTSLMSYTAEQYFFEYLFLFIFAIIYSFGLFKYLGERHIELKNNLLMIICRRAILVILFIWSLSFLVMGAHNPFIYFHF